MLHSDSYEQACQTRAKLLARLDQEHENDLANSLRSCGEPLPIVCANCGYLHLAAKRCKKKWCPVCVRAIATKRAIKFSKAAAQMTWPMHLTLTVANITDAEDVDFVRRLRRAFGKLRHRKLWEKNVAGGVAGIEVTNKGKGWHPHLHALIDCRWLALRTPAPQPGESQKVTRDKCRRAKLEFTKLWRKIIREKHGVCWMRRVDDTEKAIREVLKYAIKGSELAEVPQPVGPLIRQLDRCRLTTSFGSMFGKRLTAHAETPVRVCPQCKTTDAWMLEETFHRLCRHAA